MQVMADSKTILVVDDEDVVLEALGHRVLQAGGGKEALRVYSDTPNPIDLVLTDGNMPGMDGFDLLEALRKIDPSVKVILISAYDLDAWSTDPRVKELNGYLKKPVQFSELSAVIERVTRE
jgi:CheY-like chemotaxis protein